MSANKGSLFEDFISLLYPRNCIACGNSLYKHEEHLCHYCFENLPRSNFHLQADNALEKLFYGRVPVHKASSYYLFHKKSRVQKILHAIKYKGNTDLAQLVGSWYAAELLAAGSYKDAVAIIPVPLHEQKLKQRGYNQSEEFAKGLSAGLNIPVNTTILKRSAYTQTQTRKSKYERWENVEDKFVLDTCSGFENTHLILVDDVITTGATIEACINQLLQIPGVTVSVVSIGFAEK